MRYSTENSRTPIVEIIFYAIGLILLLILGVVASAQTKTEAMKVARGNAQAQQSLYREYRGVRLGMTTADARTKLGEPAMKSDEQDFYVFSANETVQIVYAAQKVVTISTDYVGTHLGAAAPLD